MDAVDGVAHVLPGGDEEGEGQTRHDCDSVVEPEDTAVYLDVRELHQTLQSSQEIQHLVKRSPSGHILTLDTRFQIEKDFLCHKE